MRKQSRSRRRSSNVVANVEAEQRILNFNSKKLSELEFRDYKYRASIYMYTLLQVIYEDHQLGLQNFMVLLTKNVLERFHEIKTNSTIR